MNVLIVVAHPDDEVLGCGATGAALAAAGHRVRACFLAGNAEARGGRPEGSRLYEDTMRAQSILGFGTPFVGAFPNIRLNTIPHIELVQFVEHAIEESGAQFILTHHPADVNDDHLHTARACMAAARLFQRRPSVPPLKKLFFMEVLSSTDWAFAGVGANFRPDTYFEAEQWLGKKLDALRAYQGVMRPFPHSRSEEVIRALAASRGAEAGLRYAEGFQSGFTSATSAAELIS